MNVLLVRHAYLPQVTLGSLYASSLKLATLEEPWQRDPDGPGGQRREGNLRESCIPDGTYILKPHFSARYPDGVWAIVNPMLGVYAPGTRPAGQTWGRDAVLIHSGNNLDHTEGCVLVGMRHAFDGQHLVHESRTAIGRLRELLGGTDQHSIHIRPSSGTAEI